MLTIWDWEDHPFIITMFAIPAWDPASDLVLVSRTLSRRPAEPQTHTPPPPTPPPWQDERNERFVRIVRIVRTVQLGQNSQIQRFCQRILFHRVETTHPNGPIGRYVQRIRMY